MPHRNTTYIPYLAKRPAKAEKDRCLLRWPQSARSPDSGHGPTLTLEFACRSQACAANKASSIICRPVTGLVVRSFAAAARARLSRSRPFPVCQRALGMPRFPTSPLAPQSCCEPSGCAGRPESVAAAALVSLYFDSVCGQLNLQCPLPVSCNQEHLISHSSVWLPS